MQTNFGDHTLFRMNEMPEIAVHLVPNWDVHGGPGTSGLPPAAPNGCDALYTLTGCRIRTFPIDLQA